MFKKLTSIIVLASIVLSMFPIVGTNATVSAEEPELPITDTFYLPGDFIVKLNSNSSESVESLMRTASEESDVDSITKIGDNVFNLVLEDVQKEDLNDENQSKTKAIIENLSANPNIEYVEQNAVDVIQAYNPNDTYYNQQWSHWITDTNSVWHETAGDSNVVVAVLDTGVDYTHPDLVNNMMGDCSAGCPTGTGYDYINLTQSLLDLYKSWYGYEEVAGEDYFGFDNDPMDLQGHGTHVAGIVAAQGNNNIGVVGACPDCSIMPMRVGYTLQSGSNYAGLIDRAASTNAIYYAATYGADVINMSFGGSSSSPSRNDAINYAVSQGVILVGSAGNDNSSTVSYPARNANVISVGATADDDSRSFYSNYGADVDIAAPGGDYNHDNMILSTVPQSGPASTTSGYNYYQGTSMAAPYVAGVIAMIKSYNPYLTSAEVKDILFLGAEEITTDQSIGDRVNTLNSTDMIPTRGQFFKDVKWNHTFAQHIYSLRDASAIGGYLDNTFKPNNDVTRGQMAKYIKNGFEIETDLSCMGFPDVPSNYTFYEEITTLKCKGIINGYGDGTYRPNDEVSRGAAMKYAINGARFAETGFLDDTFLPNNYDTQVFPDLAPTHTFYEFAMAGYSNNIINGYGDGTFKPEKNVSRGALSKMINNARNTLSL